tara:strand:- start:89 stop:457 length:369 start_codon:yes stop_codon:yes gene_type:complete
VSSLTLIPFAIVLILIFPLFTFKKWTKKHSIQTSSINKIILGVVGALSAIAIFYIYSDMIDNGMWYLPLLAPFFYIYGIMINGYYGLFKSSEENINFLYNRIVTFIGITSAIFFVIIIIISI